MVALAFLTIGFLVSVGVLAFRERNKHDSFYAGGCVHDWEVLESSWKSRERHMANGNTIIPSPPRCSYRENDSENLDKRVCLKCKVVEDQISDYRKTLLEERQIKADRQNIARAIAESVQ